MRKASLLMLTSLILIAVGMLAPTPVKAQPATLEIPAQTVPQKDMKFNITIWVWDVTDLFSWGVTLVWNVSICNYTGTEGQLPVVDRMWPGDVFTGKSASPIFVERISNAEGVIIGIGQSLLGELYGVNGTYSLVTIEFYAKEYGATSLNFSDIETETLLLDSWGFDIPHDRIADPVTIVPEFPAYLLMPLFLIATVIAVVSAKTLWSKRPRGRVDVK